MAADWSYGLDRGDRGASQSGFPTWLIMTVANGNIELRQLRAGGPIGYTPSFDPDRQEDRLSGREGGDPGADQCGRHRAQGRSFTARQGFPAGNLAFPVFSPDGKRVAYAQSIAGNWDVYVLTLADGTIKRLTTTTASDTHPTWSADGTRIAFTSNRSGKFQVWTVPSNGGTQVRITHTTVTESRRPGRTRRVGRSHARRGRPAGVPSHRPGHEGSVGLRLRLERSARDDRMHHPPARLVPEALSHVEVHQHDLLGAGKLERVPRHGDFEPRLREARRLKDPR